jgi:hypothetical protein
MGGSGPFGELHDVPVELLGLLGSVEGAVDPGGGSGEVQHDPSGQRHDVAPRTGVVEHPVDRGRHDLGLVALEDLPAEQAVLEAAPVAVGGAGQRDERAGHDDAGGVVERLGEHALAVAVTAIVEGGEGDLGHFCAH